MSKDDLMAGCIGAFIGMVILIGIFAIIGFRSEKVIVSHGCAEFTNDGDVVQGKFEWLVVIPDPTKNRVKQ